MSKIKISMSQINTIVGSLDFNTKKIIDKITKAKKEKEVCEMEEFNPKHISKIGRDCSLGRFR